MKNKFNRLSANSEQVIEEIKEFCNDYARANELLGQASVSQSHRADVEMAKGEIEAHLLYAAKKITEAPFEDGNHLKPVYDSLLSLGEKATEPEAVYKAMSSAVAKGPK